MKKVWMVMFCLWVSFVALRAQDAKQGVPPTIPPKITKPAPLPGSTPPAAAVAQNEAAAPDPAKMGKFRFKEETHDFGEVMDGPAAEYDFEFKNTGKSPIIISEAHGSCGCTVPKWPQEPIKPKHKGVIHVTYNTAGRVGPISKDVFITSNALQNPMKLHITGTVKPKPEEPKPVAVPLSAPPPAK